MDQFWTFVISQLVVLLGIAATVTLGALARTGPRHRIENLKLAAESLDSVTDMRQRARIQEFMADEGEALERSLARRGTRAATAAVAIGAVGFSIFALGTLLQLDSFGLELPVDPAAFALVGGVVFTVLVLAGMVYILLRGRRRLAESMARFNDYSRFPGLFQLLHGHLNSNWPEQYPDSWAAIDDFLGSEPSAREKLAEELTILLGTPRTEDQLQRLVIGRLGSRYFPDDEGLTMREWLDALRRRTGSTAGD